MRAVHAGDVIASIDDGDYRLAVDQARDKAASQEATIARIGRQVDASRAAVDQAKAQLASVEAGMVRADLELTRQQTLASRDFASRQALETAQANRDQARAAVTAAKAGVEAPLKPMSTSLARRQQEASARSTELRTAHAKAERDIRFTDNPRAHRRRHR